MRVSQISVCNQQIRNLQDVKRNCCPKPTRYEEPPQNEVQFRGKFGAWVGGIIGGAAVVAAALATAPAAICLLGGGAFVGAVGGDVAEDAVNKKSND